MSGWSVRVAAGEEVERVGGDRRQHVEALDRAARRSREVADQGLPPRAGDAAGEHAEAATVAVAHAANRLGNTGRFALDHGARALGREIARAETSPTGRDDH